MSLTHLHLLLNHFPVIGMIMVTVLLAVAYVRKSGELTKVSLWALAGLAVVSLVVFLTGEPAEEAVENLPGFSEALTERHEEFALLATVTVGILGILALGILAVIWRREVSRSFTTLSLVMSLIGSGMMGYTAYLGGQVRHTEVRTGATPAAESSADDDD